MKKNRMSQRVLPLFLTAAMILNMYNLTVLAEAETLEEPELPAVSENTLTVSENTLTVSENTLAVSENTLSVSENSVADIDPVNEVSALSGLGDDVLKEHIVRGQNPEGAVVNLFDYWQYPEDHSKEEIWDWEYTDENGVTAIGELCNLGISKGHLLRFGLVRTGEEKIWNYGAWNRFSVGKPYQGIVQNALGTDGFPRLNFGAKQSDDQTFFGNYVTNYAGWLDENHRTESLDYLFSVSKGDASKAVYKDVQGLFQMDQEGYYYYDSRQNFAEFDGKNSFVLYDSPGVGTMADQASGSKGNFGEFFPFNKASEVFNTEYDITDEEHLYLLSYIEEQGGETEETEETTEEKTDYVVRNGNASFLSCTYPALNHYIGMTLEVPFLQTVEGRLDDGSAMTFEFSGDDDVWIFIDGVLVADLGGIHDAYELSINFADGTVLIPSLGEEGKHTILDSFEDAERSIDGFSGDTFADNTKHTLQMFYLERGHMASNLSLRFNVAVVEDPKNDDPGGGDPGGGDPGDDPEEPPAETENHEGDSGVHSDTKEAAVPPAESEQMKSAVGSPQTGDDSMIGWWAALNLISLVGISATVCNMILKNAREKKRR